MWATPNQPLIHWGIIHEQQRDKLAAKNSTKEPMLKKYKVSLCSDCPYVRQLGLEAVNSTMFFFQPYILLKLCWHKKVCANFCYNFSKSIEEKAGEEKSNSCRKIKPVHHIVFPVRRRRQNRFQWKESTHPRPKKMIDRHNGKTFENLSGIEFQMLNMEQLFNATNDYLVPVFWREWKWYILIRVHLMT